MQAANSLGKLMPVIGSGDAFDIVPCWFSLMQKSDNLDVVGFVFAIDLRKISKRYHPHLKGITVRRNPFIAETKMMVARS